MIFYMTANVGIPLNKGASTKLDCLPVGCDSLHLQFKLTIWALS